MIALVSSGTLSQAVTRDGTIESEVSPTPLTKKGYTAVVQKNMSEAIAARGPADMYLTRPEYAVTNPA